MKLWKGIYNRIFVFILAMGLLLTSVPVYATEDPGSNPPVGEEPGGEGPDDSIPTPEVTPEGSPEVTPEVSPEVTPEVSPEVTPEVSPEVTPEVSPEVTPEVSPEVTPEVSPEVTPEVSPEVTPEPTPDGGNSVPGKIEIDGDETTWKDVTAQPGSGVDNWKVAVSEDNNKLCLSYTGTSSSQWDYSYASANNSFTIKFADGTEWSYCVVNNNGTYEIKGSWYENVNGEAIIVNNANHNTPAPYFIEFAIPFDALKSNSGIVSITYGGTTVEYENVQKFNGTDPAPSKPPVYDGIDPDGDFTDWDAIKKEEVKCPTGEHEDCIIEVATIWDGEKLNLYIREGHGGSATMAGTHSNGKFSIVTDLGYELSFQLNRDGTISGIDGAECRNVGDKWEIVIPTAALPRYNESLDFALFKGATLVENITNLDDGMNNDNLFDGIKFDGDYTDWTDYGHSRIDYSTSGSGEIIADAMGAVYMDDDNVYAHVATEMPAHLLEAGGEYTAGVHFVFNSTGNPDESMWSNSNPVVHTRYIAVDDKGNINWNPQLSNLAPGTYTFYITELSAWGTSTNINNLNPNDVIYGKMVMSVAADGKDEMEMYLDKNLIANKYNIDVKELKRVDAKFERIGQNWISAAGTSSGPLVGVMLGVAVIGLGYYKRKKDTLLENR